MGSVTFAGFVSNVERNIGARSDLTTQVGKAVNQAILDVILANIPLLRGGYFTPWKFCYSLHTSGTITNAAGVQSFALTSVSGITDSETVLSLYSLRDDTNKCVLEGPLEFRDIMEMDVTISGNPTQYARYGNSIYFNRTTGASIVYTMYYIKRPADIATTETTALPREFDFPVELRATQLILETPLHETDHAAEYGARYLSWFNERINPDSLATEDADFGIVPTHSGRSNTNKSWGYGRARG